jgi:anti-sigma regulatory factor (Ser/Thr protein kinase)
MSAHAPVRLEMRLPPTPRTPGIARRRLTERFAARLEDDELQDAALLISELVTNAVMHGRGRVELSARLDDDRLTVDVADQGGGFEPSGGDRGLHAVGGNGLNIVDAVASRWGIYEGSSRVWFVLERRARAL